LVQSKNRFNSSTPYGGIAIEFGALPLALKVISWQAARRIVRFTYGMFKRVKVAKPFKVTGAGFSPSPLALKPQS
jgi:hypothetical protein